METQRPALILCVRSKQESALGRPNIECNGLFELGDQNCPGNSTMGSSEQ